MNVEGASLSVIMGSNHGCDINKCKAERMKWKPCNGNDEEIS
jgi:hypothetical protein